ncbi:MAG: 3-coathanger stack domain-containing protein [Saprospiraceae bacterium]
MKKTNYILFLFLFIATSLISQIQLHNDEFEDSRSLVNWKNINIEEQWGIEQLEHYSIDDTIAGKLVMIPRTASWFGSYRGPFLFREVSGNFIVTTKVDALGRDNIIPEGDFNLAGIMLRHVREYPDGALDPITGWTAADNNYIFLSIGAAGNHNSCPGCNPPNFEVKTTINGNSQLRVAEVDTTSTLIRIARIDNVFIVLYRLETDQIWVVHERYNRPDFPDTIQVGLVTYTDWTKVSDYNADVHNITQIEDAECDIGPDCDPDIVGEFEYIRFDSLNVSSGIGTNFFDEVDVTNAELLGFLDFNSEPFCPLSLNITNPVDSNEFRQIKTQEFVQISSIVSNIATLTLSSTDSIVLNPGFQINASAILEVKLTGCN